MYLNMCMEASSYENVGAPRAAVPFYLEPILLDLEDKRYMVPLLQATLAELFIGRHGGISGNIGGGSGGGSGSGGGNGDRNGSRRKSGGTGQRGTGAGNG